MLISEKATILISRKAAFVQGVWHRPNTRWNVQDTLSAEEDLLGDSLIRISVSDLISL